MKPCLLAVVRPVRAGDQSVQRSPHKSTEVPPSHIPLCRVETDQTVCKISL